MAKYTYNDPPELQRRQSASSEQARHTCCRETDTTPGGTEKARVVETVAMEAGVMRSCNERRSWQGWDHVRSRRLIWGVGRPSGTAVLATERARGSWRLIHTLGRRWPRRLPRRIAFIKPAVHQLYTPIFQPIQLNSQYTYISYITFFYHPSQLSHCLWLYAKMLC